MLLLPLFLGSGCSKKTAEIESPEVVMIPANRVIMDSRPYAVLKATVFQMSGDYANNVAITLNSDGKVAYYPAPSDISASSAPVNLGGGWWLNRQGISANSVFTKYTFEEYSKLQKAPTPEELKEAVIPGAKVTRMVRTDIPASEASAKIKELKTFVKGI